MMVSGRLRITSIRPNGNLGLVNTTTLSHLAKPRVTHSVVKINIQFSLQPWGSDASPSRFPKGLAVGHAIILVLFCNLGFHTP